MNDQSLPLANPALQSPHARRGSFRFWVTVLALAGITLLVTIWAGSTVLAKKGSEKILRVDLLLPKLKSSHGERKAHAFRMSEPESSELAHPKDWKIVAPPPRGTVIDQPTRFAETPEPPTGTPFAPGLHLIKPIDLTLPPVETCGEPVIYQQPCAPQRGDSPMMRNWKTLTMYSLLAAATYSAPQLVFAGNEPNQPVKTDGIDELQKSMKQLLSKVTALENKKLSLADQEMIAELLRTELKKLENGPLADLKRGVDTLKSDVAGLQSDQTKMKAEIEGQKLQIKILNDEVVNLNKKLLVGGPSQGPAVDKTFMEQLNSSLKILNETIAKLGPTEKRTSMSMPNGTPSTMGRVVLVNLYSQDLLFTLNNMDIRVPARTTKTVENVPTGALRYSVFSDRWGILQSQTTNLAGNDTFTLTASNP
jgi:hypothetical protein